MAIILTLPSIPLPSIRIPVPPFPNVPALPGVPQLIRSLLFPASAAPSIAVAALQNALWESTQSGPVWGVFDQQNNIVVGADSMLDFGYRHENRISDYNVQAGQFASYNRVNLPFENSVVLTKGGTLDEREAFLKDIDAIDTGPGAFKLYNILTAEKSYLGVNVMHVELSRRGSKNNAYFDVEVRFRKIQQVAAQYSSSAVTSTPTDNAQVPSALPFVNNGLVQAQPLDFGSQKAIDELFQNSLLNQLH